jgi:hypothetical protein
MFQLKAISAKSVPAALEKAERYRLLNEPSLTESICTDILDADPGNVKAIVIMLLAITDQFETGTANEINRARQLLSSLPGEYEKHYYEGIICERKGNAILNRGGLEAQFMAYNWLSDAMHHFENAEAIRPPNNDDSILRWNTCARQIMHHHLEPRNEELIEPPLE